MAKAWRNLVSAAEIKVGAAETASTNGTDRADARLGDWRSGLAIATVGPVTGTSPTLDLKLQGRALSTDAYTDLATFAQITAAITAVLSVDKFLRRLRYSSTIAGTAPSFTYSVVAMALEFHYKPDVATIITA